MRSGDANQEYNGDAMLPNLDQWSLDELIDRALEDRLVDECNLRGDHVLIVQGTTRFLLDRTRARAFLRGALRGMSPKYLRRAGSPRPYNEDDDPLALGKLVERNGLFVSFRRHLIRKWWDKYSKAGGPFGDGMRGLMLWIRYNTGTTVN